MRVLRSCAATPIARWRACSTADMGQDLTVEVDLRLEAPEGRAVEGGPYFRSRTANPGNGIIGGTSAGFWVQLASSGQVRVLRLHPQATVAFTGVPSAHDPAAFHRLVASASGRNLQVAQDGRLLEFDAGGTRTSTVDLAPAWETATPVGHNNGSAGIAFSAAGNRDQAGGQEARNIRVLRYRPLVP